jgi:hypothetical protein
MGLMGASVEPAVALFPHAQRTPPALRSRNEKDAPAPFLETEASDCCSGDGGN